MHREFNTDLLSGLFGWAFMAFFWVAKEGVGNLSIMFPRALLVVVGLLSTALLIKGLWKQKAAKSAVFTEGNRIRMTVTGAALFVWLWLAVTLGFYIGSILTFFALT